MALVFDYDIYQVAREPILNPGLTTTVSDYINKLDTNIKIHDRRALHGIGTTGPAPFTFASLGIPNNLINGDRLSLVLGTLELKNGFFALQESAVYISSHLHNKDSGIKLIHYFAYFAAISILDYHSGHLAKHEKNTDCPFYHDVEAINLKAMILNGQLCARCTSYIYQLEVEGRLDDNLFTSVRAILAAIANEYRKDKEIDLEETINIKEDVNIKIERQAEIESDTQIEEKETAKSGEYSLAHDDENPLDALGYEEYADALSSVITNNNTGTPLTIGVCAPWGRGKTVLLGYIKKKIEEMDSQGRADCQCIEFNAWKYTKAEQIWAEFYTKILSEVESKLSRWEKLKFKKQFEKQANPRFYKIITVLGYGAIFYLFILVIYYLFLPASMKIYLKNYANIAALLFPAYLSIPTIQIIWKLIRSMAKRVFALSKKPQFKTTLGIQHEVFKYLEIVCNSLELVCQKRIIVFIDDIDRCSPGQIMQVFEAMKLFFDIENFVFIISLDTKVVRLAIGDHYEFMCEKPFEKENMGRYYLEKIIQVPFHLPVLNRDQLLKYHASLFDRFEKEIVIQPKPAAVKSDVGGPKVATGTPSKETTSAEIDKYNKSRDTHEKGQPQYATAMDTKAQVTKRESRTIKSILSIEGFTISPRLWKRFINIYLIARHLLITANEKAEDPKPNYVPTDSFIKWLALSVLYPFESAALICWLEEKNWIDPLNIIITGEGMKSPIPTQFSHLNPRGLDDFARLYWNTGIFPPDIHNTKNVLNCFNLVLN